MPVYQLNGSTRSGTRGLGLDHGLEFLVLVSRTVLIFWSCLHHFRQLSKNMNMYMQVLSTVHKYKILPSPTLNHE